MGGGGGGCHTGWAGARMSGTPPPVVRQRRRCLAPSARPCTPGGAGVEPCCGVCDGRKQRGKDRAHRQLGRQLAEQVGQDLCVCVCVCVCVCWGGGGGTRHQRQHAVKRCVGLRVHGWHGHAPQPHLVASAAALARDQRPLGREHVEPKRGGGRHVFARCGARAPLHAPAPACWAAAPRDFSRTS